jgi:proline iminopeptidase
MVSCAVEAVEVCQVGQPVDVVGHSMGSLCALALAIARPEIVRRLVLVGSMSGWPAVFRWGVPHNWNPWRDRAWWKCMWLGTRQMLGLGNLAVHKQLDNLVEMASFVDRRHVELWTIEPGDARRSPPPRACWLRSVRHVDYIRRLGELRAPTLLVVGRHDPQTPVACSEELAVGIPDARTVIFERSGHAPFIEEPERFRQEVGAFLTGF